MDDLGLDLGNRNGSNGFVIQGVNNYGTQPNTAISLPIDLFDGSGFRWDIQGNGSINDGTNDAYDGGLNLNNFPFVGTAQTEDNEREIVIGPANIGSVEVTRKIYVPEDQSWARFLEIVTNTSSSTVNYTVQLNTNLGSDGGTVLVTTSSGDTIFNVDDNWLVTDDFDGGGDPTMVHVFAGEGEFQPDTASLSSDNLNFAYNLTLAPGETQIVMHFAAQNADQATALTKATQLAQLELEALEGMSDEELQQVVNFSIAPPVQLIGTEDDDVLTGSSGGDFISGLGGNDILQGLGGNDQISGGSGDDLISAGDGNDTVAGDEGHDSILGGNGNDLINGGSGKDRILGESGDDTLNGDSGNDLIDSGQGSDTVSGGTGADRLFGDSEADILNGDTGADTLTGGLGNDSLNGGADNDRLIGVETSNPAPGAGFGAGEVDTLAGGTGGDTFGLGDAMHVFYDDGDPLSTGEADYALISDFYATEDFIQLQGSAELYTLDFFTSPEGTIDAALIYDPGVSARGEVIGILKNVSPELSISDPAFIFEPPSLDANLQTVNISTNTDSNNSAVLVDTSGGNTISTPNALANNLLTSLDSLVEGKDFVAGELIVKFKPGIDSAHITSLQASMGGTVVETTQSLGIQRWAINNMSVKQAITSYYSEASALTDLIEYIEPNFIAYTAERFPNDPSFDQLWGLNNTGQTGGTPDADIDAPEAWDISTGNNVVVGVIDTGVDYTHPDLNDNMWTNPGETLGNGIDDDGNGFVDDYYGYDFINEDGNPFDDNFHGTHVSGTIAAEGNNGIGVTGVNWNAKIMALKFLDSGGSGDYFDAIQAIEYSVLMGARITSNSWRGYGYSQSLYDAIAAAGSAGQLFVAAAGNESNNNDSPFQAYPASFDLDNIISVAATDQFDQLAGFSNFGATSVDLGAPGVSTLSTFPGGGYGYLDGTSMATPHVAGVASLILSQDSSLSPLEVKALILNSVDPLPSLTGITVSGGRLNAFNALNEVAPAPDLIGTEGDDVLTGTNRGERIFGLGGNDILQGLGGNDEISGGSGDDLISAGDGNDTVAGNEGSDAILGGGGDDQIDGGSESDRILGESGDDTLNGDEGNDIIDGGQGRDTISGGTGADRLFGGTEADILNGDAGADTLIGGLGNDFLNGGADNDRLIGVEPSTPGTGFGAGEVDTLTGGTGSDTFVLGDATSVFYDDGDPLTTGEADFALISDFNAIEDFIQLQGSAELYSLDFFTSSLGTIDAALIYDPGVSARGEVIAILQNVSPELNITAPAFTFV